MTYVQNITDGSRGRIRTYDQSVNPDWVGTLRLSYVFELSRRLRMRRADFPRFDFELAAHCLGAIVILFRPHQSPWPVFSRELSADFVGPIVTDESILKIIRVADVETAFRVLKNVNCKHGSWLQR